MGARHRATQDEPLDPASGNSDPGGKSRRVVVTEADVKIAIDQLDKVKSIPQELDFLPGMWGQGCDWRRGRVHTPPLKGR